MIPATAASNLPALATCSGEAPVKPSEAEVAVASSPDSELLVTTVRVASRVVVEETTVVFVPVTVPGVVTVALIDTETVLPDSDADSPVVVVVVVVLNRLALILLAQEVVSTRFPSKSTY